jgi:hypothetical protein
MRQNGFVLPMILVLIVLMLGIHSQITTLIPSVIQKSAIITHSIPLADSLKNNLLRTSNIPSTNRIDCIDARLHKGKVFQVGKFCVENNNNIKFLSLTSLNKINCADETTPLSRATFSGVELSEDSIRSPKICRNLPPYESQLAPEERAINGNFESNVPILLPDTLIFSGYVNIPHGISISRDIGILAAGDIRIETISSTDPLPLKLYLHSRSGQVRIGTINGNITVHCIAKSHNCNQNGGNIYWAPVTTSRQRAIYFE